MERACENCEYGIEIYEDEMFDLSATQTFVLCHRYPPQLATLPSRSRKIAVQQSFSWPLVGKKEWCGEYKAKQKE
jgi:hypothetical protein